jgi:hypothetical protein
MIEVLKQALEALEFFSDTSNSAMDKAVSEDAIASLRQAIAGLESQEPVAHQKWCASLTQLLLSMPPQPAPCNCHQPQLEQNFCPRCGKRTNDIHTCTPPQEKNT